VIIAAGQSFLWRDLAIRHLSEILEQIWQFGGGRTTFSFLLQLELDSFTILELLLYQVHCCIVFTALDLYSSDIYIIFQNWFSPGGVLSRVLDQKYLCLHMHFSCC
jgi:hypothetical protein